MKKRSRIILVWAGLALCASLTGCHKTCTCISYDGQTYSYTDAEVNELGGNCYNMRNYPLQNYYSVCNWE